MKLVRDKIPEIIEADGKWCLCRRVHGNDEHLVFLRNKMLEETDEFLENPSLEEAADVYEVLITLCKMYDFSYEDVVKEAVRKREARGGFVKGIVLERVGDHG